MGTNTERENIITRVQSLLDGVDSILKTSRSMPKDIDELQSVPQTQIPFCVINAAMPVMLAHKSTRSLVWADKFETTLDIAIVCYYVEVSGRSLDVIKSDLFDDLFVALNADQSLGGHVHYFEIIPDPNEGVWEPYGAFRLTLRTKYIHGIGGI